MIDKDKKKPIYKQLVDEILDDIKQGRLNPEDKLPTERELAERLGLRGTVKYIRSLLTTGQLVIQGSGSYIHNNEIMTGNEKHLAAIELLDNLLIH
ncbi:MAG: GntR family transcriptional regulator [Blautia marasmi]